MSGIKYSPSGRGNKRCSQSTGMPTQFFVHPREDNLLSNSIPFDGHATVLFQQGDLKVHGSTCAILAHHQIEHGVIQRSSARVFETRSEVVLNSLTLLHFTTNFSR